MEAHLPPQELSQFVSCSEDTKSSTPIPLSHSSRLFFITLYTSLSEQWNSFENYTSFRRAVHHIFNKAMPTLIDRIYHADKAYDVHSAVAWQLNSLFNHVGGRLNGIRRKKTNASQQSAEKRRFRKAIIRVAYERGALTAWNCIKTIKSYPTLRRRATKAFFVLLIRTNSREFAWSRIYIARTWSIFRRRLLKVHGNFSLRVGRRCCDHDCILCDKDDATVKRTAGHGNCRSCGNYIYFDVALYDFTRYLSDSREFCFLASFKFCGHFELDNNYTFILCIIAGISQ